MRNGQTMKLLTENEIMPWLKNTVASDDRKIKAYLFHLDKPFANCSPEIETNSIDFYADVLYWACREKIIIYLNFIEFSYPRIQPIMEMFGIGINDSDKFIIIDINEINNVLFDKLCWLAFFVNLSGGCAFIFSEDRENVIKILEGNMFFYTNNKKKMSMINQLIEAYNVPRIVT